MSKLPPVPTAGRTALLAGLVVAALCACAPAGHTVADDTDSARVPSELQPVMPAPHPVPTDDPTATEEDRMDGCNADAARKFIGQIATADVIEQARKAAGAALARTLQPGQVVTMEYHPSRLNIDVDDANVVANLRCG